MTTGVARTSRADLPQHHASRASDRTFTGNANLRPTAGMESVSADIGPRPSAPLKQPATTQPVFTIGSGAMPVSPSKKRMHNALKMRQAVPSATASLPPRANPFAQYGVANGVSNSQASRSSAHGSPVASQPGFSSPRQSPRKVKVVRPSDGVQGMNIDSNTTFATSQVCEGAHAAKSQPAAANTFTGFATQPAAMHTHSDTGTAASTLFPSQAFKEAGTGLNDPAGYAPKPEPNEAHEQADTSATNLPSSPSFQDLCNPSARVEPAATPPAFRFGMKQADDASKAKPSMPFRGFGLHAPAEEAAPATPSASFSGFQPGIQSKDTFVAQHCSFSLQIWCLTVLA